MKRILFVCLGNIVRSPLAANLFLRLAEQAGVSEKYTVDSAGTGTWHIGEGPDARMRHVAARRGLQYTHTARQFKRQDFDRFDLIIPMDRDNRDDLLRLARSDADRAIIHLMRAFDPQGGAHAEVPDPFYGGPEGFEQVYQIIERSCKGLLQALEEEKL